VKKGGGIGTSSNSGKEIIGGKKRGGVENGKNWPLRFKMGDVAGTQEGL